MAVQRRVAAGVLSAGHARALLGLEDAGRQEDLSARIVAEGLSVRGTEEAVTLAVIASIRHEDTEYDALLMSGVARADARDRVRAAVDEALEAWRHPAR